jgi:methylated-DNA-protein-cysteine methyltransferase-like protein
MPKSAAFERIQGDVLKIAAAIPVGKVTTFRAIGVHLDVMPRHVAYILALLPSDERALLPWHRVVADDGRIGRPNNPASAAAQATLLRDEGIAIDHHCVTDLDRVFFAVNEASTGVPPGLRPPNARAGRSIRR